MKYRMYCLSERHLSIAQKTIQAAHAIVEYQLKYGDTEEYRHWAEYDKTIIVLDGGSTPEMVEDIRKLSEIRHNYEIFTEPDMGNFVTSIAFLADERVFDYETYGRNFSHYQGIEQTKADAQNTYTDPVTGNTFMNLVATIPPIYDQWLNIIGGKEQETLKEIISTKKLAL